MIGHVLRSLGLAVLVSAAAACGGGATSTVDGGTATDVALDVVLDADVDDAASPPDVAAADAARPADTGCATDDDGDGVLATACGGDDCDDRDPHRFPGNAEVCDAMGHDEDCNPCTVASATTRDGDGDMDGYVGIGCFNSYAGPAPRCDSMLARVNGAMLRVTGLDCDDTNNNVRPNQTETCNDIDDNCDGMVDERATRTFFRDADGDGFGDRRPEAMTRMGCSPPAGYVENSMDCDDAVGAVNPSAREVCDGVDNNCDGMVDESGSGTAYRDADGDGYGDTAAAMPVMGCAAPMGYVLRPGDCNDGNPAVYPTAPELCDRVDDDCSMAGSAAGGPDVAEDADRDGHSPASATCVGRGAGAAAAAFPKDDCDDTNAAVNPGRGEVCDGIDNDCAASTSESAGLGRWGCQPGVPCLEGRCASVRQVRAGLAHGCMLREGSLQCWGTNFNGELGQGDRTNRAFPIAVPGLTNVVEVDAFGSTTCARRASGEVFCWGAGFTSSPAAVPGIDQAIGLAIGSRFLCVLRADRTVWCRGENTWGQLGDGTTTSRADFAPVADVTDAVQIAAGSYWACALRGDGTVWCWGQRGGATGLGPRPTAVAGVSGATQVALDEGFDFSACATVGTGDVRCWGANVGGTATAVAGLHNVARVVPRSNGGCAMDRAGALTCWGTNNYGQLGDGTRTDRATPVAVTNLGATYDFDIGAQSFTCAITRTGELKCWGVNGDGQLGTTVPMMVGGSYAPTPVTVRPGIAHLSLGDQHTCAVTTPTSAPGGADVYCWGSAENGRIATPGSTLRPALQMGGGADVFAGYYDTCRRYASGEVLCQGARSAASATSVASLRGAAAVFPGDEQSVALRSDGTAVAFLGSILGTAYSVAGLSGVTQMSWHGNHGCAVVSGGGVRCFGRNEGGMLGDGTTVNHQPGFSPVTAVTGLPAARAVATSSYGYYGVSCAALVDGTVRCWGRGYGNTPVAVPGVTGVTSIATGTLAFYDHVCVLLNDDGVRCWGANSDGQLGAGAAAPPTARTPVTPRGLWRATGVYAGGGHTCATQIDGAVYCWGNNRLGQVGDGTADGRNVPTLVTFAP